MSLKENGIIPDKYIPGIGSRVETIDGENYLISNDTI